jgi:hypothetical protein
MHFVLYFSVYINIVFFSVQTLNGKCVLIVVSVESSECLTS